MKSIVITIKFVDEKDDKDNQSISGKKIYSILSESFKKESIKWVKKVEWKGPIQVQLSEINLSEAKKWAASALGKNNKQVNKKADAMNEQGPTKPVILIRVPGEKLLYVCDGRHRILAAKKANVPILAYIGIVENLDKEMSHNQLHQNDK